VYSVFIAIVRSSRDPVSMLESFPSTLGIILSLNRAPAEDSVEPSYQRAFGAIHRKGI
jgi:hypothetical protein